LFMRHLCIRPTFELARVKSAYDGMTHPGPDEPETTYDQYG
jgi:hypothetical protein